MNLKVLAATSLATAMAFGAAAAFAQPGSAGSAGTAAGNGRSNAPMTSPAPGMGAIDPGSSLANNAAYQALALSGRAHAYNRSFAQAFTRAEKGPPSAILLRRDGRAGVVLSSAPARLCTGGAQAAFTSDGSGGVLYGCATKTGNHYTVCWLGYSCLAYSHHDWQTVALRGHGSTTATRR